MSYMQHLHAKLRDTSALLVQWSLHFLYDHCKPLLTDSAVTWQVEPDTRTMILSEREAIMDDAIQKVQPGSIVTAVVRNLVPYGAFVSIKDPESGDLSGGHVSSVVTHHGTHALQAKPFSSSHRRMHRSPLCVGFQYPLHYL